MSYNGLEIDMLSLGDADCLLVTRWAHGEATRVLVDGGNKSSYPKVTAFLHARGATHLHHVVCSHPHDDHVGGLLELALDESIFIGEAWVHRPFSHVLAESVLEVLRGSVSVRRTQRIMESLETTIGLLKALGNRGVPIHEPFQGQQIAFMTVCGPAAEHYKSMVSHFADASAAKDAEKRLAAADLDEEIADAVLAELEKTGVSESLLDDPVTSPENECCTVLGAMHDGNKYLLTADAGARALALATVAYDLQDLYWMQIPHHGSRRNITAGLLGTFKPEIVYVSARGSIKHPRRSVVNALKAEGAAVYSTHYPNGGHLWHHRGNCPQRPTYSTATPLWEAKK